MNSKKITVSAVVPAFNEAPRIVNVLSFLQSCADVHEIVCVDDGSEDKTSEIVKNKFPDVKLITLPQNKGKGNAVAVGIENATCDVVLLVDADLMGLKPEHIGNLLRPMLEGECDIVVSVRDYWSDSIIFRSLSGERAYKRKDLLPHLEKIKKLGFKLELYLNYTFCEKKVKTVLLEGVYNPLKWQKMQTNTGLKSHMDVTKEIWGHIAEQESPLEYFYKACVRHFYLPFDPKSFSMKTTMPDEMKDLNHKHKKELGVSVVIPAHNEEKYIEKTLKAIKNQTVAADEIIVVDNGCTDETASIAAAYGCRIIKEPKKGISHARNTGFDAAKYEVIARTDADTLPDPQWIERIKKYTSTGVKALTGPVFFDAPMLKTNPHAIEAFMLLLRLVFGHSMWFGANMVITKELWQKSKDHALLDDKHTHEDAELAIAVSKYADIQYKRDVIVMSSSRRMRNDPSSFFLEYQLRLWRMAARLQRKNIKTYYNKIKIFLEQDIFSEDW